MPKQFAIDTAQRITRKLLFVCMTLTGLWLAGTVVRAQDLNFSLSAPTTAAPGTDVSFYATLSNSDSYDLYLNSDATFVECEAPAVCKTAPFLDDSPYFSNSFPAAVLSAKQTDTDVLLFIVDIAPDTPIGTTVDGSFGIIGGATTTDSTDLLGTAQDFSIEVVPVGVPEGGASFMYLLLVAGACLGTMFLRSRSRRGARVAA